MPEPAPGGSAPFRLRRGTPEDMRPLVDVFAAAMRDLTARIGVPWEADPDELWRRLGPMLEMIGAHAAEWWVAEHAASGELIGYARSVARGGLFELSEFFVHPGRQSAGVGAALLARAFPDDRGEVRVIIATPDVRAQARYYRAGTAARFPIVAVEGTPRAVDADPDVQALPLTTDDLDEVAAIEREVLEFDRGAELGWLLEQREGYRYRRDGETIGFGFVSRRGTGPIATRRPDDQPPVLAHLESRAAALGVERCAFEVPMVNEVAIRHLLDRGFRFDPFFTFLMSNRPFGRFDRYIGFAPPFVL